MAILCKGLIKIVIAAWVLGGAPAHAMSLVEAVRIAVASNPEIGEAISNREAIEFELEQGRGLFRPRVDLEARIGGQKRWREGFEDPTLNPNGTAGWLNRREASMTVRQLLFDGFESQSEVERQAARVDGASYRVMERAEFVALAVAKEYIDILRLREILGLLRANERYHEGLVGKFTQGTEGGSISVADRQQARERLFAAKARTTEASEQLANAEVRFVRLVGRRIGRARVPANLYKALPRTVDKAIGHARDNHPSIKFAQADVDAASALVRKASAQFAPKLSLEGRARAGDNLDGERGQDNDVQGNVVMQWNLFNGGIDAANRQEQIRRTDEARMALHRITREVEEGVRLSWDRRRLQSKRLYDLHRQLKTQNEVLKFYTDQFEIGQRSLLDLLDAQSSRVSAQIAVATGRSAVRFADYRILASVNRLLVSLDIKPPSTAYPYARTQFKVPPTPPAETTPRYSPKGLDREPDFKSLY